MGLPVGLLLSVIIRSELVSSGTRLLLIDNCTYYNIVITLHGLIMIFFVIMPVLYSSVFIILSLVVEYNIGSGWTLYPPLSTSLMSLSSVSIDVIVSAILLNGMASNINGVNIIVTYGLYRSIGLTLNYSSLLVISILITSYIIVLVVPVLTIGLIFILLDIHYNCAFYDANYGGDNILYQHLFWFFGHPEVYILILPSFGIISHILADVTAILVLSSYSIIISLLSISALSFIVWVHHIYINSLDIDIRAYFSAITLLISIPTGNKIYNYTYTLYVYYKQSYSIVPSHLLGFGNSISLPSVYYGYNNIILLLVTYITTFIIGGNSGVILSNASVDIILHDGYYVISHFHFILSLGSGISILLLVMYYSNIIMHNTSVLGLNVSSTLFLSVVSTSSILLFGCQAFLGYNVMNRRILDYSLANNGWNSVISSLTLLNIVAFVLPKK